MSQTHWSRTKVAAAVVGLHSVVVGLLFSIPGAYAQQLPIRRYNVGDGLAHSGVRCIHQDAKGYLWLGTWDGLSRFDGYRFTNYDVHDGLGHILIDECRRMNDEQMKELLLIHRSSFMGVGSFFCFMLILLRLRS